MPFHHQVTTPVKFITGDNISQGHNTFHSGNGRAKECFSTDRRSGHSLVEAENIQEGSSSA